jgi:hypothetical protein
MPAHDIVPHFVGQVTPPNAPLDRGFGQTPHVEPHGVSPGPCDDRDFCRHLLGDLAAWRDMHKQSPLSIYPSSDKPFPDKGGLSDGCR